MYLVPPIKMNRTRIRAYKALNPLWKVKKIGAKPAPIELINNETATKQVKEIIPMRNLDPNLKFDRKLSTAVINSVLTVSGSGEFTKTIVSENH
jgi:hypothetical protein